MAESRNVVIASSNPNKVREFSEMLIPLGFSVSSIEELGVTIDQEETGVTFKDNALIKAKCISDKLPGRIVIADDSGLEVHGLGGFPGIRSARFMEGSSYHDKCRAIIERLKGNQDRTADYISAIALVGYDKEPHVFIGTVQGRILEKETGTNGFGYDPIFYCNELKKPFGFATSKEKNMVSHRGKALRSLLNFLKERN